MWGGNTRRALRVGSVVFVLATIASQLPFAKADPGADIAIAIDAPAAVAAGASSSFKVVVRNDGAGDGLVPAVTLFARSHDFDSVGLTASGTGWTCNAEQECARAEGEKLAALATLPPITVSFTAPLDFPSVHVQAQLTGQGDPDETDFSNHFAEDDIEVTGAQFSDMAVAIKAVGAPFAADGNATFEVTASNKGTVESDGPAQVTIFAGEDSTASGAGWTCSDDSFFSSTCTTQSPTPANTLLPVISVVGPVPADAAHVSASASVEDTARAVRDNDSDHARAEVRQTRDVAVTAAAGAARFKENGNASFDVTVRNAGTQSIADDIDVQLSLNIEDPIATGPGWTCVLSSFPQHCTHEGPVAAGATLPKIHVTGKIFSGSKSVGFGAFTSLPDDANPENNNVQLQVPVDPTIDFVLDATTASKSVTVGGTASFSVIAKNVGSDPATDDVTIWWSSNEFASDSTGSGAGWVCEGFNSCVHAGPVASGASLPALTITGDVGPSHDRWMDFAAYMSGGGDNYFDNNHDSVRLPLFAPVDLRTIVSDGDATFEADKPGRYTVTVTNHGGTAGSGELGLDISTSGPQSETRRGTRITGVAGTGWTCDPQQSSASCTRTDPSPANAALPPVIVDVVTDATGFGTTELRAHTSGGNDSVTGDNFDQESTPVTPFADVRIGIVEAAPFVVGREAGYDVTVSNALAAAAPGEVSARINLGFQFEPASIEGTGTGWTCTAPFARALDCEHAGPVPADGSLPTISVTGRLNASSSGSTFTSASVETAGDDLWGNNSASRSTPTGGETDLAVALGAPTPSPVFGQEYTFPATVSNALAAEAAGKATLTLNLSPALGGRTATSTDNRWSCAASTNGFVCTHPGPVPASGALAPVVIKGTAGKTSNGEVSHSASLVGEFDGKPANNHASVQQIYASPVDLAVNLDDKGAVFPITGQGGFTVTVDNIGSAATNSATTVAVQTSRTVTNATTASTEWSCVQAAEITCTRSAAIAGGGTSSFDLAFDVPAQSPGSMTSSATVANEADGRTGNDTDHETTQLAEIADLGVAISDNDASFTAPGKGSYEIVVRNAGSVEVEDNVGVELSVEGPATASVATGTGWTCNTAGDAIACTHPGPVPVRESLPPITFTVDVEASAERTVTGRAIVRNTNDTISSNNVDTEATPVVVPADLTVAIAPGTLVAGREDDAQVTVSNVGTGQTVAPTSLRLDKRGTAAGDGWTCATGDTALECTTTASAPASGALPVVHWRFTPTIDDTPETTLRANVTNADDGNTANNSAEVVAPVAVAVDLFTEMTPGRTPYVTAQTETFSVVVRNNGAEPSTGVIAVTINQNSGGVPEVAGDGWECLTLFGETSCTHPGPVPAGGALAPIVSSFEVVTGDYPQYSAAATIENDSDLRTTNNRTEMHNAVLGVDLGVKVTDPSAPAPAAIGQRRVFSITSDNHGGLAPPGAATLTITPGVGLLDAEVGNDDWTCTPDEDVFVCTTNGPVPADGDLPALDIDFYVGGGAYPNTSVEALIAAPGEAHDTDNVASVSTNVTGAPDLVMTGAADAPSHDVDTEAVLTWTVHNQGSVITNGHVDVVADQVPGMTFLGSDSDDWVCASDEFEWNCTNAGPVEPDSTLPALPVRFMVGAAAYPKARVVADVDNLSDEDPNNNRADASFAVTGLVDLETETASGDAIAGREHVMPLDVRNKGTVAATGPTVAVIDTFSPGVTPVRASGPGWACTTPEGTLRCEHPGPIAADGSLPRVNFTVLMSDTAFDVGQRCRFADVGRGDERVCSDAGIGPPGYGISGTVTNASDPRSPLAISAGDDVVQPSDLSVTGSAAEQFYMGDRAAFALQVADHGLTRTDELVRVRARLDCGFEFGSEAGENNGCDPGLDDLEVLGPLTATGAGWACEVDGVDDKAVTCTRAGLPAGEIPPILVSADMAPTYRGWFVLRPTVFNVDDTNPFNDQTNAHVVVDRRRYPADGKSDLSVVVSKPREREWTVGVNDIFRATVINFGGSPTSGEVTTEVTLGTGFRFLRDEDDGWECSAVARVVTCTSSDQIDVYDPDLGGGTSTASFVVGIDAAAMPVATHTINVAFARDPVDTNNEREQTDAVFEGPVPTAVMGASRTVVPTPSTIEFDGSLSQNTRPSSVYRWDFGDGVSAFGEKASHEYTRTGVYTATLRVFTGARYSTAKTRIIVYPDEPLVAEAGDDVTAEEGDVVEFDGGASRPALGIQSYRWDFGDGDSAIGRTVAHDYTEPGTYDVTLTVRIGNLTAVDTTQVVIVPAGTGTDGKGLVVQVDDIDGKGVRVADVTVYDRNGRKYSARADANGRARIGAVPNGAYTVYAYRTGYQPGIGRATVVGGGGNGKVVLKRGDVGEASIEHRRLTRDEIVAEGIDPNDPANQNVVEFSLRFDFLVYPDEPAPEISEVSEFIINGDGEIIDAPDNWECDPDVCISEEDDRTVILDGEEDEEGGQRIVTLIVPGKARFLKEFFEITMLVSNLGPKGFSFTNGAATLDMPDGLALAPMSEPQELTQAMADIPSGGTGKARWIVRGDKPGLYDLGASYTGVLDPVGSSILLEAQTKDPLKVWGADAVHVRARAQREVRAGRPYRIVVGLENISDVPVYNAGFDFLDLEGDSNMKYAPWTNRQPSIDEIAPASTWWVELWFIPDFNGELVACTCEDGPGARRASMRSASFSAAAAGDGQFDTSDLVPFTGAGASGGETALNPSTVAIESVPDDYPAFTATAKPGVDHLAWEPVEGATGYRVYRSVDGTSTTEPVAVLDGDVTSFDVASVPGARSYTIGTVLPAGQVLAHPRADVGEPANTPTPAISQKAATAPGEPVEIDVFADENDVDGDTQTVRAVTDPEHGTVTCEPEGVCTYTPDAGFTGTDSFVVTAVDEDGNETTQTVTVEVGDNLNHPPVAVADSVAAKQDRTASVNVLTNDSDEDDDALTVTSPSDPSFGSVECAPNGECTYEADAGRGGVDQFTYTVSDGNGGTATASVKVTVPAPAATNQLPVAAFTNSVAGAVASFDASTSNDPDGVISSYVWDFGDGELGSGVTTAHTYSTSGPKTVKLTVTDDLGAKATKVTGVMVTVPAGNAPPTAVVTSATEGLVATLDGTSSTDTDGSIVGYVWDFGDGLSESGAKVVHTYAVAGTYDVILRVIDDDDAVTSKSQKVTVSEQASNQSPVASFTSSVAGRVASFDASASADPDGTVESYAWTFGDNATGTGKTPSHTYAAPGTYTVVLTVTDDDGATGSVTKTVVVSDDPPANVTPTASFTSTVNGSVASFDASASSDSDGTISSYAWNFGDGTTGTGKTPSHTYATPGTRTVTLTVTDDDGATGTTTRQVTTTAPPANVAPTASFTSAVNGAVASFDASASSDSDGTISSYAWNFGDGTTGTGKTPTHTYETSGTRTVTLTVTDDDGATGTTTRQVTTNTNPPANVKPTATFTSVVDGLKVALDASGSNDPDGAITEYLWDFGDSPAPGRVRAAATATGPKVTHTYAAAGTYTITLTVTDDRGDSTVRTQQVGVSPAPTSSSSSTTPPTSGTSTSTSTTLVGGSATTTPTTAASGPTVNNNTVARPGSLVRTGVMIGTLVIIGLTLAALGAIATGSARRRGRNTGEAQR